LRTPPGSASARALQPAAPGAARGHGAQQGRRQAVCSAAAVHVILAAPRRPVLSDRRVLSAHSTDSTSQSRRSPLATRNAIPTPVFSVLAGIPSGPTRCPWRAQHITPLVLPRSSKSERCSSALYTGSTEGHPLAFQGPKVPRDGRASVRASYEPGEAAWQGEGRQLKNQSPSRG
jgi:hypothetical protein